MFQTECCKLHLALHNGNAAHALTREIARAYTSTRPIILLEGKVAHANRKEHLYVIFFKKTRQSNKNLLSDFNH